jgi:hypothetical protein
MPLWDNIEKDGQAAEDNIILCMSVACWMTKATYTHSEYATLIANPPQECLSEGNSIMLYIHCLSYVTTVDVTYPSALSVCV